MSNTPNPVYEKLMKCYESFRSQIDFQPEVALILGSGLGDFANDIRVTATLDYHDIEGFPVSTVPGHAGRFIFGYVGDVPVVCMQGRVHYYEGYPMTDVVLPPHEADGRKSTVLNQRRRRHQTGHKARLSDAVKRPDRLLRSISAYRTEHRRARHPFPGYEPDLRP